MQTHYDLGFRMLSSSPRHALGRRVCSYRCRYPLVADRARVTSTVPGPSHANALTGQTVARNVQVEFTPTIEPEGNNLGVRATLIRKFAKPVSVLAPGAELDTLYFTPEFTGDEVVNAERLPDELRVTISYDGPSIKRRFGRDYIHRYEDSFDLDTIPVRPVLIHPGV